MTIIEFLLILFCGVVLGLLLSLSLRWAGRKLPSGNNKKEGAEAKEAKVKDSSSPVRREV